MSLHPDLEALSAFLDAELDSEDEAAVREHVETCDECGQALEELRGVDVLARAAADPVLRDGAPDIAAQVRARLLAERSTPRVWQGSWLAAAAALGAVLVFPWLLLDRMRHEQASRQEPAPAEVAGAPPVIADRAATSLPPPAQAPLATEGPAREAKKSAPSRGGQGFSLPPPKPAEPERGDERLSGRDASANAEEQAAEALSAVPAAPAPPPQPPPPASAAAAPADTLARRQGGRGDFEAREESRAGGLGGDAAKARREREPDSEAAFRALTGQQPSTGDAARRWREEWRAFLERYPQSPHLPRARQALLSAGALAYRIDGREDDLVRLRRDVEEVRRAGGEEEVAAAERTLDEAERRRSP
jgi:hypothetical protein